MNVKELIEKLEKVDPNYEITKLSHLGYHIPVDGFYVYKRTADGYLRKKEGNRDKCLEFSPELEEKYDTVKGAIDFFSDWI